MDSDGHLKILVVDDHVGIRIGIASLIDAERPRMACAGTAATVREALARTCELQPDVVVLDVNLGGEDGLALIAQLRRDAPCEVVVLTSLLDPRVAQMARRWGAHGCVHKTAPAAELLACIAAAGDARTVRPLPAPANAGSAMSCAQRSKHPYGTRN